MATPAKPGPQRRTRKPAAKRAAAPAKRAPAKTAATDQPVAAAAPAEPLPVTIQPTGAAPTESLPESLPAPAEPVIGGSSDPAPQPATAAAARRVPAHDFQEMIEMMFKSYEDYVAFATANADAMSAAYTTAYKGMDAVNKAVFAFQKLFYEMTLATTREVMQAKTLNEVVDLQTNYARNVADNFMTETTKLSELGIKVANETLVPINKRVTATVEQVNKTVEGMTAAA